MAITFQEFDTTQANLVSELFTRITAHADWADITPGTQPSTTQSATGTTSATAFTVASTAGMFVGQRVKWVIGGTTYYRQITVVTSATAFSVNASLGVTTAIGQVITFDSLIVKATTTRGAEMILDLTAGETLTELFRLNLRFWQELPADYATANTLNAVDRYLYFRASGGTTTQVIHVTLSISKEHLFVQVEGPRAHETGAFSTTYGSLRNYLFFSDVVPYHAEDTTPCVVASSGTVPVAAASVNSQSHLADLSRNYDDDESWQGCRLGSITFPTVWETTTVAMERDCTIDGNKYLFPYVVFGNKEGMRGRLARFFFAGSTAPTSYADSPAPVGEKVTFDGIIYKLLAVNKADGTNDAWGAFGAADNGNATAGRSVVVAVPYAEVAP